MSNEPVELYKRFRPKRWDELIGQEKVAKSLQKVVLSGEIPTAYIFSGPRGTGKTSTALLLAKSINCLNREDDGNPCNECEVCMNIDNGTQLGVSYTSMANFGGVEDIRDLVREAELNQPVKRSIFILDETHNLSKKAFDALLIPLEKASMPALFIFCTTEIEKIPETINSRIQARKLTLVPAVKMKPYLKRIASLANLDISDEEIDHAVKLGRGSVRDTLSALDTIVAMEDDNSVSYGEEIITALSKRSLLDIYETIARANNDNVNFRSFSEDMFEDLRDMILLGEGADENLINLSPVLEEEALYKRFHGKNGVMIVMNEIADALTQMSQGMDHRIRFEIAMLRALQSLNRLTKMLKKAQV